MNVNYQHAYIISFYLGNIILYYIRTIAGQSAGAMSVACHLTSSGSKYLRNSYILYILYIHTYIPTFIL